MNTIPSAHDFIAANTHKSSEELLIEFAKLHVQACKEDIFEYQETEQYIKERPYDYPNESNFRATKNSILNSYPLNKII